MSSVFNADDNDIPFFGSRVRPSASLSFSERHSESHVPGRHLNGLLNAEEAIGIALDEEAIEKHTRAAFFSYSGPVALPLNRAQVGGELVNFSPHNVREGFHALYSLVAYRDSEKARALAEASIECIFEYWDPERDWKAEELRHKYGIIVYQEQSFIVGLARSIGPLVKYFRTTGHGRALELATLLKDKVVDGWFAADGGYEVDLFGTHTHSATCVMSGLVQLADLTSDAPLMARVKAFYDNGLWAMRDELGWVIENNAADGNPDRGEVNNTGDILETALILGRWGYADCYQDAERILRGHLLPSQLRDVSFIEDPPNPNGEDGLRDVANRHLGAFGFPAPYGHQTLGVDNDPKYPDQSQPVVSFNMDIVGGTVGSLCEAYRESTRLDATGHSVNLLFDHETDAISVKSPYTHDALTVVTKTPGPLRVRIPVWASHVSATMAGTETHCLSSGGYLFFAEMPVGVELRIEFALESSEIVLKHRTRQIRVQMRGDSVQTMDNFGADLTFFEQMRDQA
ncbi:MAG: hypothetical protein HQ478_15645 [Chloroflexi bacterium]|nr:hypothetical protein [Chloroflexota bacterium]